ncbi:hypothetical protein P167DRAFT_577917 [Morchella conica CCBAS932]|uniref:Uncharacterized protein n=1 Tax=Morchella conica CCBAS932 TaxID=1392247 RepID=A0A3N4KEC4_9PEZI|nr:hypothetical protein P167DRAFT_577917 [Morchella conica CCBAS932]
MAVSPAPNGDGWTTTFCFPLPLPPPPPPPIGLVGWEECLVPAKESIVFSTGCLGGLGSSFYTGTTEMLQRPKRQTTWLAKSMSAGLQALGIGSTVEQDCLASAGLSKAARRKRGRRERASLDFGGSNSPRGRHTWPGPTPQREHPPHDFPEGANGHQVARQRACRFFWRQFQGSEGADLKCPYLGGWRVRLGTFFASGQLSGAPGIFKSLTPGVNGLPATSAGMPMGYRIASSPTNTQPKFTPRTGPFQSDAIEFLGGVKGGIGRFTRQTSGAQAVLDGDDMGGFADNFVFAWWSIIGLPGLGPSACGIVGGFWEGWCDEPSRKRRVLRVVALWARG